MRKMFFVLSCVGVIGSAATSASGATEVACRTEEGRPIYDPDFCKAIKNGQEALAKVRALLDRSEEARKEIDRQLKQQLEDKRRGLQPRR